MVGLWQGDFSCLIKPFRAKEGQSQVKTGIRGEMQPFVKSKTNWFGKNPTCGKKSPFLGVLRGTETAL
jgi:hypothetical protein